MRFGGSLSARESLTLAEERSSSSEFAMKANRIVKDSYGKSIGQISPSELREMSLKSYRNLGIDKIFTFTRKYHEPGGGYWSVKKIEEEFHSIAGEVMLRSEDRKAVAENGFMAALKAANLSYPLFWVGKDIAEASRMTNLPEATSFDDLKWPMDSMILVMPDRCASLRNTETGAIYDLRFTVISRLKDGDNLKLLVPDKNTGEVEPTTIPIRGEDAVVMWSLLENRNEKLDTFFFTIDCDTSKSVEDYASKILNGSIEGTYMSPDASEAPQDVSDKEIIGKFKGGDDLLRMAVNLLFLSVERPELIERSQQLKKVKTQEGKVWSYTPRWLGRKYKIKREYQGGSHASPRLHWRVGHRRNQACGEGLKDRKTIWIEPVLVNAKEKE